MELNTHAAHQVLPNVDEQAVRVQQEVRAVARELRLRRRLRLAARGLWLGLALVVAGLVLRLLGFAIAWPFLVFPAAFVGAAVAIWGWFSNPSLSRLTHDYDRHFRFDEMLGTGLEVARRTTRSGTPVSAVEQRLLHETLEATWALRRRVDSRPIVPWREIERLLGLALFGVALLIAGRWTSLPDVSPVALRPLPSPPAATPQPSPEAAEEQVAAEEPPPEQLSPEDQAAADALADALRDSGPGRPAADALDRGDTDSAASELRELADQAGEISPEARRDIAEGLHDAADQLRESQPDRADTIERAADQLEGSPEEAAAGLDDLAGLVDELGQDQPSVAAGEGNDEGRSAEGQNPGDTPPSSGDGAQSGAPGAQPGGGAGSGLGGESRGAATSPPPAAGEVVPLPPGPESDGPRTAATGPQGPNVQLEAGGSRSGPASGSAGNGGADTPLEGEADPLRIPPEYRDVVENYFSPPS